MKSITVFVITYNQEDVIRRAMDSILCQKDWGLHQIIIGDDCSKDNTFEILQEYKAMYPGIVRPIRNERNLGIYGNLQNLINYREESDLYYIICSGDDALCDGYFKSLQEFILNNNISTEGDVGFFSDWKSISPLNEEKVRTQEIVNKGYRLWGLQMRGLISVRSLIVSRSVINQFKNVPLNRGLRVAESLFDSQASRIIKKAYYIPYVASIYYTGIGVSTELSKTGYATTENIAKWNYYKKHLIHDKRDSHYAQYQITRSTFLMNPSIGRIFIALWFHLLGLYPFSFKYCVSVFREFFFMFRYWFKEKKQ